MNIETASHQLVASKRKFQAPKPIPERLAEPTEPQAQTRPAANGITTVEDLARAQVIRPALSKPDRQAYFQFLLEHVDKFAGFMSTLAAMHDAQGAMGKPQPTLDARRDKFFDGCTASAVSLLGEEAATLIRHAFADTLAAYDIVGRFESPESLPDDAEDAEDVRVHNVAMDCLDALLVCLYESRRVTIADELKEAVVALPVVVAADMLERARRAADRRGVAATIKTETVFAIWRQPSNDLVAYLEEREPSLVTEELRDSCAAFSDLSVLIGRVGRGESVASEATKRRVAELSSLTSGESPNWAKDLAADLARFKD